MCRDGKINETYKYTENLDYKKYSDELKPETYYMAMQDISNVLYYQGQYEDALRIDEEVYAKRKSLLGEDHPDTINALYGIGIEFVKLKKYGDAMKIFEEVYNKRNNFLGENHPEQKKLKNYINAYRSAVGE